VRSLQRAGLPTKRTPPRRLATIAVQLSRVLDLTDAAVVAALGVAPADLVGEDVTLPQRLGGAAHYLGFEAILAPSATGTGVVLALFLDTRAPDSVIDVALVDEGYAPTLP